MADLPALHAVTDDAVLARADFGETARRVLEAGGPRLALHLRGPRTGGRALHGLAAALLPAARGAGALLLVNDRADVALAAGADGVRLGARGIRPEDARRLLGAEAWIGASVHTRGEAEEAAAGGADFLVVGTLYATPSHPGREGAGPAHLAALADVGLPRVGIGGITPARAPEVRAAGAHGVAVLRGVWDAPDPARAVEQYLKEMSDDGR